ncbi:MAG TPA: GMC family oxidoreductase [Kofleriaceae bacterium]|nr:GMC family oxidoreductase [Kofleriaceae bacterium]
MSDRPDVIIIGSGFGGAMVAHRLLERGARVAMLERGDWVGRGPEAWRPEASLELTPHYDREIPYRCVAGGYKPEVSGYACVGGPSVFYGCTSFRFRERDFAGEPDVVGDSGAAFPFDYDELEPYYDEAEALLQIAGDDDGDPTAPRRRRPYPQAPAPLAPISQRLADAARARGLSPFRLPLAINHGAAGRAPCQACRTCDTFACAIEAKNDVATMMIRPAIERGLTLHHRTVVTGLVREGRRITGVDVVDRATGAARRLTADTIVLAAGALGTPHLLLASGLDEVSPARAAVGRYLMRHANAMVFGFYPRRPDPDRVFHKQVAIHDWYFGAHGSHAGKDADGLTKLGGVQQVMTPPRELVRAHLPWGVRGPVGALTEQLTGLLCIAEDQPRHANGVTVDRARKDRFGLPQLVIETRYSARDERALAALVRRAKRVLRGSGAWFFHTHQIRTFSHALGSVRMGGDPAAAPVDPHGRYRGLDNLWIADGSVLPLSAGVNPSLTIAATALRTADFLAGVRKPDEGAA